MTFNARTGGANLRAVRTARGDLQTQVADASRRVLGEEEMLHNSTISRIETGDSNDPSFASIATYAYMLGLDLPRVAEWYGLPTVRASAPRPAEHSVVQRIQAMAGQMPALERERFYARIEGALLLTEEDMRRKQRLGVVAASASAAMGEE